MKSLHVLKILNKTKNYTKYFPITTYIELSRYFHISNIPILTKKI